MEGEIKMDKEKWLRERRKGIGGSDVADVLSLEPYGCAARLFDDKRNLPPDFLPIFNADMERGTRLESIAIEIYAKQSGNEITNQKLPKSKYNFMLGNVDGLILKPDCKDVGVLEIKCPNRDSYTRIKKLGLPESYILQMQHYLCRAKATWGEWGIFCADKWEMLILPVARDEELINLILEREERFWRHVENGPRPDRLEWGDKRCKSCCYRLSCWKNEWVEYKEDASQDTEDEYIEDNDKEFVEACKAHSESGAILEEAQEVFDSSREKLFKLVGDRERVKCREAKIIYARQVTKRVNLKEMKSAYPDLVNKYEYESISRPFRFYNLKGD